jgi:two-component system, NarL family, nitrate/nitrite response regulator NarL
MWRLHPCCHTCLVRCLLVDDNGAFIETARLLLAREGVVVAGTASSIAEALRQASALRPDVVLVDIGLGDENGFDLARRLAGSSTGTDAAVIMISTRAGADYADMVADSPAAGFLAKDELSAAAIHRILGRERPSALGKTDGLASVEEGQHREDPAVNVIGFRQVQLHEDAPHVLLHGSFGHPELA